MYQSLKKLRKKEREKDNQYTNVIGSAEKSCTS